MKPITEIVANALAKRKSLNVMTSQDVTTWRLENNCTVLTDPLKDHAGTQGAPLDPLFGAVVQLANTTTYYIPLQAMSLAVDNNLIIDCPAQDQVGSNRPIDGYATPGALCDSGAHERVIPQGRSTPKFLILRPGKRC